MNEDAVLSRPDLGLWAVADGMGGHDAGEVASAMVVDALGDLAAGMPLPARAAAARAALGHVNRRLLELASGGPRPRTIGTTVVAVLAEAGAFACLWVGDSRVYRLRGDVLEQVTHDHSLVQELVDMGELTPDEAERHPNANVITRAVGSQPNLEVDVVEGDITPGDVILLASDGLTRLVSRDELAAGLKRGELEQTADAFIETCLERGAPDNVSLVIVRSV